jgi:lysophospholipid acyltransferase (LPLAT)-like uncharacterized protein
MGRVSGPARDTSFRDELKTRAASGTAFVAHRLLTCSYRLSVVEEAPEARCAYSIWHGHIWVLLWAMRGRRLRVMVSEHRDGEFIARVAQRLGYGTVRGSSTRGGARALLELARAGREGDGHLLLTVDGPRGPAREVKEGIVFAASRTGLPVVPVGVAASRAWMARSWDRHVVPKPFARVAVAYGPGLAVPQDAGRDELAGRWLPAVAEGMRAAEARAWRELGREPPA